MIVYGAQAVSKMLTGNQGDMVAHLQVSELSSSDFMAAPSVFTAVDSKTK